VIVYQLVPALHRGDAIGDSILAIRDQARRRGHQAEVFAIDRDAELEGEAGPLNQFGAAYDPRSVTLLHFALASPWSEIFGGLKGPRVLVYHNITPAEHFLPYRPDLVPAAVEGRRQLAALAGRVDLALADSAFNREELTTLGYRHTRVWPIPLDLGRFAGPGERLWRRALASGPPALLFVGRIFPNKKIEDLLRLLAACRARGLTARLIVAGRAAGMENYLAALHALAAELELGGEDLLFPGSVSHSALIALYRGAALYVSMSEHEGFGVPLLEAMRCGLPVLAYSAAAVPDTLAGAGITFDRKDFPRLAETVRALLYDRALRAQVLRGQRRRLQAFRLDRIWSELFALLEQLAP
jgi:glycosyltransferase involved in cell wall biosynthesis